MAHPKRFELLTPRFVVWCSIQLSYGCAFALQRRGVFSVWFGKRKPLFRFYLVRAGWRVRS